MKPSPANLVAVADQFLVAYACTSSVEASSAALFNVGHATELYLKAVMCLLDPGGDIFKYQHNLARLLQDIQDKDPDLLSEYSLRRRAIDLYLTNVDLPEAAKEDPDYTHFNEHREWYWVSTYLMDTKYLFAAHGPKLIGKSFAIMILGLNEYWQQFFKLLRIYLRSHGVEISDSLLNAAANPNMPPMAQAYLRALA